MRYFADEDKNYDTEEVVGFLAQVGAVNNKEDIKENADAFGTFLAVTAGFSTGEEFRCATLEDIKDAKKKSKIPLTDVSVKTIWRYMTGQGRAARQGPEDAAAMVSPASNGSSTETEVTTSSDVAKAMLKLANSTANKQPEYKDNEITVNKIKRFIKEYKTYKTCEWTDTGLTEAANHIIKNMDKQYEDLIEDTHVMIKTNISNSLSHQLPA